MAFDKTQRAYVALRDQVAERTKPLLGWVGAGLSAQAGLPGWEKLKQTLVDAGLSKARSMDPASRTKLERQLDPVHRETNLWRAFSVLRDAIGPTTYHDEIRRALIEAPRVRVPEVYRALWRLPIRGIFNLNIDRIATRAFHEVRAPALPNEFTADQIGGMTHVLGSIRPFIGNLHGNVEQVSTWVFTQSELSKLLASTAYLNFVRSSVAHNSILFLGITADDRSVGGHLEWFAKNKISTGPHYWLTDRRDSDTDNWAEKADIRVIRYMNADGSHREIEEFFADLLSYVPEEDVRAIRPVISVSPLPLVGAIPDPATLAREETERIRQVLNAKAATLLTSEGASAYERFEEFCAEYDEPIHRAWYVSTQTGKNRLLGYTLDSAIARGAFGQVYKAYDAEGQEVAIKLLNEEIRTNPDLLRSFRRGVKSMKLLQERGVHGMVKYIDASEIPAFVAMEWVNGPNLHEAIKGRMIDGWDEILKVGCELASIIGNAHALPERVLHRDLRPANIMLKGFYEDPTDWSVVVLDFDLSWHRGAVERSVMHSTVVGYLAPEQIEKRPKASTRHAAVDSYGFGMTLFFMCAERDPITEEHKHANWERQLENEVVRRKCSELRCLPTRIARLILVSTSDEQSKRLDMGQIQAELNLLRSALREPGQIQSSELIAEEIASRSEYMAPYAWSSDRGSARFSTPSGLRIEVSGDEIGRSIDLEIEWNKTGAEDRRRMADLVDGAVERCAQKLSSGGWRIERKEPRMGGFRVQASVDRATALGKLSVLAASLDGAAEQVRVG